MRLAADFSHSPMKRLTLECNSKPTVRWLTFFLPGHLPSRPVRQTDGIFLRIDMAR